MSIDSGGQLIKFEIRSEIIHLLQEKAIYWPKKNALFIADLHIGKVTHFRKNNIPVPAEVAEANFNILENLLRLQKPKIVYFLGDLFHSIYNKEWEKLCFLLARFKKIEFILISGNHDILNENEYKKAGIKVCEDLEVPPFYLSHHPDDSSNLYNLCGHIHPSVVLRGNGKQYIKLPCFYFNEKQGILPAFGKFTGFAKIKVKPTDHVFAILNNQILALNTEKRSEV